MIAECHLGDGAALDSVQGPFWEWRGIRRKNELNFVIAGIGNPGPARADLARKRGVLQAEPDWGNGQDGALVAVILTALHAMLAGRQKSGTAGTAVFRRLCGISIGRGIAQGRDGLATVRLPPDGWRK